MRIITIILTFLYLLFGVFPVYAGNPPVSVAPVNNTTVISSKVEWQTPAYSLYSTNPYRVQVDDDSSFPSATINKDYYTDNTYYSPTLSLGTWYWRVKAKDSDGAWSSWSDVLSFTLADPIPTPTPISTSSPSPTTISSFTISNVPSEIDSSQILSPSINLSLPSSPNTKFYLKGAFKKSGLSNYFGMSKVNSNWVKNSSAFSEQYEITTDSSGNWSGNLDVAIDAFDSGYEGSGDYIFKVARYSSSGSGPTWSNEIQIKINAKEVGNTGEEIGVINLSKVTPSPSSAVLAVSTQPKKSEEPYSLEKYQKTTTESAIPLSPQDLKIKSEKGINPFIILGSILISLGLGYLVYIFLGFRLKS